MPRVMARVWARHNAPERAICARVTESIESLPLPSHPALAAWASVMNGTGHWAFFCDAKWRYAFETDDLLSTFADMAVVPTPHGTHFFGAATQTGPAYAE